MCETWTETTLGEVTELNPEATKNFRKDQAIRYIDLSSVSHQTGISEDLSEVNYGDAPGRARRVVRADDVLVSTVRPYLKGFAQVPQQLDGEVASTGFTVVRAKQDKTLAGFVWALVGTETFVRHLMDRATGSNYPAVRPEDIASFTFMLPPLALQRRIVNLLSSVDSYIGALQQQADAARVARAAVLSELLSAGGEDWIEMTIESFARLVPGKYIPKSKYEENGPYFIYGSNSVMGKYSTALIDVPHVVMAAIGAYAGAVRYSRQPSWVNNNAFGLVTNDNVDPFFFYLWLEQCLDLRQVVVGTGQPYVQRPALKNTVVNVPPVTEQRRIVDIVSSMDDVFSSTERAIFEAKRLRSGLLSDLLSGHHTIPESYDRLLGAA